MTFQEYFQQVKERFQGADVSGVSDPTRIQINITGKAAGTFYVAIIGGQLSIEPYEYHDRDVELTISDENFWKIVDKKAGSGGGLHLRKTGSPGGFGQGIGAEKTHWVRIAPKGERLWKKRP